MSTEKDNHAERNAEGWMQTISEYVAALECDYDRLEELRDERQSLVDDIEDAEGEHDKETARGHLAAWDKDHGEELAELTNAATANGETFTNSDDVRERIQESPLSVQVRSGWVTPGETMEAYEFEILLTTGGPALRIIGDLDEHNQPERARLQYQDWGTPWTEKVDIDHGALLTFCQQFYFGE
jgi:hypothetical protein